MTRESSGDRVTWTYDAKYQLRTEQRDGAHGYNTTHIYDPAGNRTLQIDSGTRTTYVYDVANQLNRENTSGSLTTYLYDAAGNRTEKEAPASTTFYSWDSMQRMIVAEPVAGAVTMVYDADTRRVRKTTPGDDVKFIYDGKKLLQDTEPDGDVISEYTFSNQEWGMLVSEHGTDSSFPLPDAQGNAAFIADPAGSIDDTFIYKAFGQIADHTGASDTHFTYIGQQSYFRDAELDLYLLGSGVRFYDPATARFHSQDQKPSASDLDNLYRYAFNDSVNNADPSGYDVIETAL